MSDEEFQRLVLNEFKSLRREQQVQADSVQEKFDSMQEKFYSLHQELVDTRREMRERFDQSDTRFDQMDERFDQMDERFERLERHSEENVQATLNVIHDKVVDIQDTLSSVSEVLGDHELRIRKLVRRTV